MAQTIGHQVHAFSNPHAGQTLQQQGATENIRGGGPMLLQARVILGSQRPRQAILARGHIQAAVVAANPPADPTACATATHADRACCCRAGCPWGYAVSTDTPTSPAHADRGVIGRVCGPPGNSGSSTPETAGPCAGTVSPWKAARWFPTIGPALPALSVKDARSASWLCDARRSHPLGDGPGIFLINVLRADLDIEQSRLDVGVAHQSL